MCGIAGFCGEGDEEALRSMIGTLRHRGPDDEGIFLRNRVGLAHARLSVLDVSAKGHQPMWNEKKTVAIVFNGEIYNFRELKETLLGQGERFVSETDTEVILHLYDNYGEDCLSRLNGMFAFALYDFQEKKLLLARDRAGEKPLYFALQNGTLVFGSEIKALLAHPSVSREIDRQSLLSYLALEYVPSPRTIFQHIQKLPPATALVYQNGMLTEKTFWAPDFSESDASEEETILALDEVFQKSVAARLVADVPVGVFLSGGIDSSAIAYYAQRARRQKIKTFSIGFEEKSFDESASALLVAKYLGTDHRHLVVSAKDSLSLISTVGEMMDEPIADASILPTLLLSEFARKEVTVALGGDGGDELFAGYPTFFADRWITAYRVFPTILRRSARALLEKIPASEKNFSFSFNVKKFFEGAEYDGFLRHMIWLGSFPPEALGKLLSPDMKRFLSADMFFPYAEAVKRAEEGNLSEQNRALWGYFRTYLPEMVLAKVDRASMKHSLEVRSPFLDRELVEQIFRTPYDMKVRGFTTKYILKKLVRGKIPDEIIDRKKKGFGIPLARWLKYDLKGYCDSLLSQENIEKGGVFDFAYIERLKQEHYRGANDHRKKLWTLLSFEAWRQNFFA